LHQPAVAGERGDVAGEIIAADDIENDVDTLAAGRLLDDRREIFAGEVDGAFRAETLERGALLRARCRGEDAMAEGSGDLDRRRADAAAARAPAGFRRARARRARRCCSRL
jgi:hypothetical protein